MTVWIFFHVLFVFVAFAFTTGVGVVMAAIARSADPRAIRVAVRAGRPMTIVGGVLLLLAVVVGFATTAKMQVPLSAPWLVAAYIMAAVLLLVGPLVFAPWLARLGAAAQASPDDRASAELIAVANARAPAIAGPVSGLMWLGLLYVMFFKP